MATHDLGNIVSSKGDRFRLNWNDETKEVWLSRNVGGPWHLCSASSIDEAKKNAQAEVENIII